MTVSAIYRDNKRKRTNDWLISVRKGAIVQIMRYATEDDAIAAKAALEAT